jgi:hypothetical protein
MMEILKLFHDRAKSLKYLALIGTIASVLAAALIMAYLLHKSHEELSRLQAQTPTSEGPDISSVITELKQQIAKEEEHAAANNEADILVLKAVDLELSFTVTEERTVEGKLEPKLIAVTSNTSVSSERVQKIVLHLDPAQPIIDTFRGNDGLSTQPPAPKNNR